MTTIAQKVQQDAKRASDWEAASGMSWVTEHPANEPKIYILKELLSSPAYRSLSAKAMLVYQDFLAKRIMHGAGSVKKSDGSKIKKWKCINNGKIVYPYSEAEKNGISRRNFRNAIDELQGKGLIDITHIGKGGRKPQNGEGDSTMYALDDRWKEYDEIKGQAIKPPRKPRKPDTRSDRGFKLYWSNIRLLAIIGYVKARCKQILSNKIGTGLPFNRYPN